MDAQPVESSHDDIATDARHVLISVNPMAGSGRRAEATHELASRLRGHGLTPEVCPDLAEIASKANDLGRAGLLRAVVAAGGDGTIAELVNRTRPDTPLAILPLGTENLLAKFLGQRPTLEDVAETIVAGRCLRLDAGCVSGRAFLLMLGAGFDAAVVEQMHVARAGHITHASWIKPIWQTIRSYEYPRLRIYSSNEANGADWGEPSEARWVFVVNLPCYARGLKFVRTARGDDGWLDVCTFASGSFWSALKILTEVWRGTHDRDPACKIWRCRRLRIESDHEIPYQTDGDFGGALPVEIDLLPGRVRLVVPAHHHERLATTNHPG